MHYEVWIKGQLEKVYDHLILAGTYLHMKGFLYYGKGYLFIDNKICRVYEVDDNGNKKDVTTRYFSGSQPTIK